MTPGEGSPSAWAALRLPIFRSLWIATVASNVGTSMHDVGAAWLMTSLAPVPLMVSLVQAASTLPTFVLAIPAGALADVVDRRRLLLVTQGWMLAAAALLGALALAGAITPWMLVSLTFVLGLGAAMNAPAWQAIMPELVPREDLPGAITLNGAGFNIARAAGPAIGGFLVAAAGPGAVFLLNALSFCGVLVVLHRWRRAPRESALPAERFLGAVRVGLRFVRQSPGLRVVLLRGGAFSLCASAAWALLPLVARQGHGRGPGAYGLLLGALGLGAVLGAAFLPRLKRAASIDTLVGVAVLLFAAMTAALATLRSFALLPVAMVIGGAGWLMTMSTLNVSAQTCVPSWVRARAMSVFLFVFFGGMAGGSALWGAVAGRVGIRETLGIAAAGLIVGQVATRGLRIRTGEGLNLEPSLHWRTPVTVVEPHPDQGPVLVMIEYRVDPARAAEFRSAMDPLRRLRLRDGAIAWSLFMDPAAPERQVECFLVESWVEHLRQHERVTVADRETEGRAHAFHLGEGPPVVSHFVAQDLPV